METDTGGPSSPPACDLCGKPAVYLERHHNRHLCGDHFIADIEERVRRTLRTVAGILPQDRVAVALSGGKDSTVLLHLLRRLLPRADLVAVTVDEGIDGYREATLRSADANAHRLGIEHITLTFSDLYGKTLDDLAGVQPARACGICGILRKKAINTLARRVGASKIATGHNLDDEAQSVLMNWLRGDRDRVLRRPDEGAGPGLVPRVKPLGGIPEREVALYGILKGLFVELPECPYMHTALRGEVRGILTSLERDRPGTMGRVVEGQRRLSLQLACIPRAARPLRSCERCGDPATGQLCQACRLLDSFSGPGARVSPGW